MNENKYDILWNEDVIASGVDIQNALIFVKALTETYYDEMSCGAHITLCEHEDNDISHGINSIKDLNIIYNKYLTQCEMYNMTEDNSYCFKKYIEDNIL